MSSHWLFEATVLYRRCKENNLQLHPVAFPLVSPVFYRFLTDEATWFSIVGGSADWSGLPKEWRAIG